MLGNGFKKAYAPDVVASTIPADFWAELKKEKLIEANAAALS